MTGKERRRLWLSGLCETRWRRTRVVVGRCRVRLELALSRRRCRGTSWWINAVGWGICSTTRMEETATLVRELTIIR